MKHNCVIVLPHFHPGTDKSDVSRTAGLNKWCIHPVRWKKDRCLKEDIKLSFIQCTVCTVFTLDYGQLNKCANELFCVVQKSSAKKEKPSMELNVFVFLFHSCWSECTVWDVRSEVTFKGEVTIEVSWGLMELDEKMMDGAGGRGGFNWGTGLNFSVKDVNILHEEKTQVCCHAWPFLHVWASNGWGEGRRGGHKEEGDGVGGYRL